MGYTTDFAGSFVLDKPLTETHKKYLEAFSSTRRMARKQAAAALLPDPVRIAAELPIGREGSYFVGGGGFCGQDRDDSVIDYNEPPVGQPSLWCQWVPTNDGTGIVWDGGEKFYEYVDWIDYLIANFLSPWGYTLNGEVYWYGEDREDAGIIVVKNNVVSIKSGRMMYEPCGKP